MSQGAPGVVFLLRFPAAGSLFMSGWQSNTVLWDLAVPSLALQAGFPSYLPLPQGLLPPFPAVGS